MVFKISNDIKWDVLESSIRTIVSRHEVLRTLIKEDNEGNGYQLLLDDKEYPLEPKKIDITDQVQLDIELNKEVNHVYDLSNDSQFVYLRKLENSQIKTINNYNLYRITKILYNERICKKWGLNPRIRR